MTARLDKEKTTRDALTAANGEVAVAALEAAVRNGGKQAWGLARPRDVFSSSWVLVACALWFFSFQKLGAASEALPWYLTIGAVGAACARQAVRKRDVELNFEWIPKTAREPLTFLESWAIAFFAASLSLYLWIALQPPASKQQQRKMTQFVDIQLVSHADATDRNSPMPGTKEAPQQHRRDSDRITQQGSLSATRPRHTEPKRPAPARTAEPNSQSSEQSHAPLVAAGSRRSASEPNSQSSEQPHAPLVAAGSRRSASEKPTATSAQQPLIEEVQPPEMVELVENDGSRQSTSNFESGGNSTGGSGAQSALNIYIKELHKRIKNSWQPPRGQSRKAQLLFRIRQDGKLGFIRVVASSGDGETDAAAIQAVEAAVNGKSLPQEYPLPYLDVQYTFNYTADELKEIKVRIQ